MLASHRNALPGVSLRRRASRSGKQLVEPHEEIPTECDLQCPQRPVELSDGAGADDRGGHTGLMQQPGQGDVGGVLAQFGAQVFPLLDRGFGLLETPGCHRARAAAFLGLAQDAPEHTAGQGRPGNQSDAIGAGGGEYLQLHGPAPQVLQGLLGHEAEHAVTARGLLGLGEMPAREVR